MMATNFITFDLETARWSEPPIDPATGLGIICAAAYTATGTLRLYYGGAIAEYPAFNRFHEEIQRTCIEELVASKPPAPEMTPVEVSAMLRDFALSYAQVITWNGLSFDFHVAAVESGERGKTAELATSKDHIDLMWAFQSMRGHYLSLRRAAEAIGLSKGAGEVASGDQAPAQWAAGNYVDVLLYNAQDALLLRDIALFVQKYRGMLWTDSKSRRQFCDFGRPLHELSVADVRGWPEPDTSWMKNPISRHKAYEWVVQHG